MDLCSCSSALRYSQCCSPLHRGEREAQSPEQLMRSRFCAFARKQLPYLRRTLHPSHPDASRPEADVLRELRASAQGYRYVRLHILGTDGPDARGVARVLFLAELFEHGKNRSFVELSEFEQVAGAWRYARGEARLTEDLTSPRELDIAAFLALPSC